MKDKHQAYRVVLDTIVRPADDPSILGMSNYLLYVEQLAHADGQWLCRKSPQG